METDIFERFRCKSCGGNGRFDDIPCTPCQGAGYTIPHEQRQLWGALMRALEIRVIRFRTTMLKEAEQQFNKYFPPENPLCTAHPNVRNAIAGGASTSTDQSHSVNNLGCQPPRTVTSVLTGWLKWPKVMRLSRRTILTGE
jgi:hypothetical protein